MDREIIIVGAGPTGLVLALWLARLGIPLRIVDKAAGPGTTSRAVAVQARTLEFYRQVHLADEVVRSGIELGGLNLWARGSRRARVQFGRMGAGFSPFPYVLDYPQDEHERLLIERLSGAWRPGRAERRSNPSPGRRRQPPREAEWAGRRQHL